MKNFLSSKPNSYPRTTKLNLDKLIEDIQDKRTQLQVSEREVLRQLGEKTPATLNRLKSGTEPSTDLFIRILVWLGTTDISSYIKDID